MLGRMPNLEMCRGCCERPVSFFPTSGRWGFVHVASFSKLSSWFMLVLHYPTKHPCWITISLRFKGVH